jgi:hypothetical protein
MTTSTRPRPDASQAPGFKATKTFIGEVMRPAKKAATEAALLAKQQDFKPLGLRLRPGAPPSPAHREGLPRMVRTACGLERVFGQECPRFPAAFRGGRQLSPGYGARRFLGGARRSMSPRGGENQKAAP